MIKKVVVIFGLTVVLSGCSRNKDWMIRQPAVESTIGNDPTQAPKGTVIPPPGMGVDLGVREANARIRVTV